MTGPTTTTGIRISPQLWAEFGLLARSEGKTRNGLMVDLVRAWVIERRAALGRHVPVISGTIYSTTTHSAKEE